jgi:hypothetical protein
VRATAEEAGLEFIGIDKDNFIKDFMIDALSILSLSQHIVATAFNGVLSLDGVGCQQYMHMHSDFLRALTPHTSVSALVNNFRRNYFTGSVMVGVHYRSHNSTQDWAVVPPNILPGNSAATASKFGEGASYDDFAAAMRMVQNKLSYEGPVSKNHNGTGTSKRSVVRFFLASNSPEAKQSLLNLFPNSVFVSGDYS